MHNFTQGLRITSGTTVLQMPCDLSHQPFPAPLLFTPTVTPQGPASLHQMDSVSQRTYTGYQLCASQYEDTRVKQIDTVTVFMRDIKSLQRVKQIILSVQHTAKEIHGVQA